jgi:uncharacterized protein YkwD
MSARHTPPDILGMPHRNPFTWLVLIGVCCSFTGMLQAWSDASAAEPNVPSPSSSAHATVSAVPSSTASVVVTQVPPQLTRAASTATPAHGPAGVIATPTPTMTQEPAPVDETPLIAAPADPIAGLPAATSAPLTGVTQTPAKATALLDLMNGARADAGLPPLARDASLEEVAIARARNLITNGYFDHYAPDGESAFSELAARGIRYRLAGENLARNNYVDAKTVEAAFDGLMASEGHRANILEPRFANVGVATVQSGHMWIYVTVFKD